MKQPHKPTWEVWQDLFLRPITLEGAWRLGNYYRRRYGLGRYIPEDAYIPYLRLDVHWDEGCDPVSGFTWLMGGARISFERLMEPLGARPGQPSMRYFYDEHYSLSEPLARIRPWVTMLRRRDHSKIMASIEPDPDAIGIDFIVRSTQSNEIIRDPVTREHAEALIHYCDRPEGA